MSIKWDIRELDSVDSTNLEMQRLLAAGPRAEGLLLRAEYQSLGRGYQDNTWESETGKNLLLSLLLKPSWLMPSKHFLLSMIAALSLHEVVEKQCDEAMIKWPNDLLAGERKIAGILIENSILGRRIEHAVLGVGLNVNQSVFQPYQPPATSLKLEKGCHFDIPELLKHLLDRMETWYDRLRHGAEQSIREAYLSRLFRFGQEAWYRSDGEDFPATIRDIALSGGMIMQLQDGQTREFAFKEVEYLL